MVYNITTIYGISNKKYAYYARMYASFYAPTLNMHVRTPLHPPSKSKIEGLRTCSAFLLNDFSRKQLSEGVMNCSIISPSGLLHPLSTLTMSLWLVIKATQE